MSSCREAEAQHNPSLVGEVHSYVVVRKPKRDLWNLQEVRGEEPGVMWGL